MSFSSDSRLLAVQNGAPDWNLVVWHWERAKLMGSARTANGNGDPITQVFPHSDATARSTAACPRLDVSWRDRSAVAHCVDLAERTNLSIASNNTKTHLNWAPDVCSTLKH